MTAFRSTAVQPTFSSSFGCHRKPNCGNALGITGFVVSLLGVLFTCGLLAPVGLLLSVAGLFRRPRGLATAGVVIGLLGTLWLAAGGLAVGAGVAGASQAAKSRRTVRVIAEAAAAVENHRYAAGELPDNPRGQVLIVDFTDAYGNALHYQRLDGNRFEVRSAGPDELYHTTDDLTNAAHAHLQ